MLLSRVGTVGLLGGLAGCTTGSSSVPADGTAETTPTDAEPTTPTPTSEPAFDGNWGLPPCRTNADARVVVQNYDPESGVGRIYNRTSTNLLVSVMNEAGYTAEDNQGNGDIYVPFGETEPFRLGGRIASVVTMTEANYRDRRTVDWLYRHDSQANEGCTLPARTQPSSVEVTPNAEEKEEERIKDSVREAVSDDAGTTPESTPSGPSYELSGEIRRAVETAGGVEVDFSVTVGTGAPSSVSYLLRVFSAELNQYERSGSIDADAGGTVSKTVHVEFEADSRDTDYAVSLLLEDVPQDDVLVE
jgi:hypothetical protein